MRVQLWLPVLRVPSLLSGTWFLQLLMNIDVQKTKCWKRLEYGWEPPIGHCSHSNWWARYTSAQDLPSYLTPYQILNFWPAVTAKGVGMESNTISGEFPSKPLTELISSCVPGQPLRFADQLLLELPTQKLQSIGFRAFSVCTPYLWDSLPFKIKSSASVLILTLSLRPILFGQPSFRFLTFSLFRTLRLLTFSIFRVFFLYCYICTF